MVCKKTYVRSHQGIKEKREQIWFRKWITEGYSLRQLCQQSHWSHSKLKRIKKYWLDQEPPAPNIRLKNHQHLVFDGTYFSQKDCLMIFWDSRLHQSLTSRVASKESYLNTISWFKKLKGQGLSPVSITMDGQTQVIKAIGETWPDCLLQRCLYHIQRQSEMWLRRYPKTNLAFELKLIIQQLSKIKDTKQKDFWWKQFQDWKQKHSTSIKLLSSTDKVESDIIRAYRMIENAYPNMFHYLDNQHIPSTSNGVEGYFSHLKRLYRQHAGLRRPNLKNYLLWYVYFKRINLTRN